MNRRILLLLALALPPFGVLCETIRCQEVKVRLTPSMMTNEAERGNPEAMVDEQDLIGDPPSGEPESTWTVNSKFWKTSPYSAYIDFGQEKNLSNLWIFDTYNSGELVLSTGKPGDWQKVLAHETRVYKKWEKVPLDVATRYLRLSRTKPSCIFSEIALYEYTPEGHKAMLAQKEAEAKAKAERDAAMKKATEEAKNRPVVDLGPLFGRLSLVDEIDCAAGQPDHDFVEDPAGASRVEAILDMPCRVLRKTTGEAAYFAYRIGRYKLLKPGAAYLLTVEYPEDAPRSVIVMNGGNETSRGFHTGNTFGDAFHPKYVNNNSESLDLPLSGKYETWKLFFHLHDRFPDVKFIRGKGRRELISEQGFTVAIAQFSAANIPASRGAAVSRIRLFEVPDPESLYTEIRLPPDGLPRRHLFWREEMADGVIASTKEEERGVTEPLAWYQYKASTMRFLGMNTYSKDLLEFGACQGWDSTAGGGNQWVFFNKDHKDLWKSIVGIMGQAGFDVLPYYEYSGSKGYSGLGNQRRAKPLTRDDAYTHISWIESANADITDPDTYADFKKMLDLTIVRHKDKARFLGAWLRPRSQMPIGFGDATRSRFAKEANGGQVVSRQQLIDDPALLDKYYDWWYGKRHEFLVAMRDHLRNAGVIPNAVMLFTADPSEPGIFFPTWEKRFVTNDVASWTELVKRPEISKGEEIHPVDIRDIVRNDEYLKALLAPRLNWGDWEVHHSSPPSDPNRYKETEGVLMTHCFNRLYTVSSPKTFDLFRSPAGLAAIRHYALNENMMYDKKDQPRLGYFVVDVERAGPFCMSAEAHAMAHGDPNYLGYLVGNNFGRGFPEYVRSFNLAYLALPALPSTILPDASSDPRVVGRVIPTERHGSYLAIVNTDYVAKPNVTLKLPVKGKVTDAATGELLSAVASEITLSMHPCQLRAFRIE